MLEAEKMSVARAEMWGEEFSKASISAQFLTIQTGPTFNVVVGFKAVGNSFFFHFG